MMAVPLALRAAPPGTPDVRYLVYSETAIELFWQTPSGGALVVGYEITRDDELLGVFDARSYFDDTLQSGTEYTYGIRAIDANGEISDDVRVTLKTRSPRNADVIISQLQEQISDLQEQLANSIPAPLPITGQTISYVDGDDGYWQSGLPIPNPRLVENVNADLDLNDNGTCDEDEVCNGTVTDRLTGLVWLQDAGCLGNQILVDGIATVNSLAADNSLRCSLTDGSQVGDWRMPNIRELLSIIDFSQSYPAITLPDNHPFQNVTVYEESGFPASYWSSTSIDGDGGGGYTVSLSVGWVNRFVGSVSMGVWAVRDAD